MSKTAGTQTIVATYDSANTFFNSKYFVNGSNFISGYTGYFSSPTTINQAGIKITISDQNNPIVSLIMISSGFEASGSPNPATAPILTHLKSVGALEIFGAMTFVSDNGNNLCL